VIVRFGVIDNKINAENYAESYKKKKNCIKTYY